MTRLIKAPLCLVCHLPLDADLYAYDELETHPSCEPPNPPQEF
jgi:hypothetical protein